MTVYLRVSTDGQAASGLGLEAQRQAVEAYCASHDLEGGPVFTDTASGRKGLADRPALFDALQSLRRGDVLLVAKRDRIARDPVELGLIEREISKRGARLVSAAGEGTEDDDPASVLMRRMLDAFAEYEVAMIRARTRAASAAKRRRGESTNGKAEYGYDLIDGQLVENPVQQANMKGMAIGVAVGTSYRELGERYGLAPSTVLRILRRAQA